nr:hypothetical protein [uncultured Sphingosinicella sp.]
MNDIRPAPAEERAFFTKRLQEETLALKDAQDTASAWRHRRLVTRYEVVLSLYEGARVS